MANKFIKGDKVKVISGKDKGKVSTIISVDPANSQITLEDVNVVTKHTKKTDKSSGGLVKLPAPIHWSNVSHLDADEKVTKVSFTLKDDGSKVRLYKSSNKEVPTQ